MYNNLFTLLEASKGPYSVTLSLSPSGSFSGTYTAKTISGVATFSGLRILSGGSLSIVAACPGVASYTSSAMPITNYIYSITLTSDSSTPSAGFTFIVSATVLGEDGNPFTTPSTVLLSEASGVTIHGTTSASSDAVTGVASFSIYIAVNGGMNIVATYGSISKTIAVTVMIEKIKMTVTAFVRIMQPGTSLDTFSVTAGVYDNSGNTLESTNQEYTISLSLSGNGVISGTHSGRSTNGQVIFSSLRVVSMGTFTLTAASTGTTSAVSSPFSVINYAFAISLSPSNSSPSVNFPFTLTALITGEDTAAFLGSCTASLTINTGETMYGTLSTTTSTGTATFTIYLSTIGDKVIDCTCPASGSSPAVVGTIDVKVLIQALTISLSPIVMNI